MFGNNASSIWRWSCWEQCMKEAVYEILSLKLVRDVIKIVNTYPPINGPWNWPTYRNPSWSNFIHYYPPTKLREGNAFIRVCLSAGVPMWPLSLMHWTSLCRSYPFPPDMGSQDPLVFPLVTSGGHHWRPVQTCSLPERSLVLTSSGEIHRVCASMWYASYCNPFLFLCSLLGKQDNLFIYPLWEILNPQLDSVSNTTCDPQRKMVISDQI